MHGAKPDFRVRDGERIVGYERHIEGRSWFSPDGLWWRGVSVAAMEAHESSRYHDMNTGWRDAHNRWVFVHDVLSIQWKNPLRRKWSADVLASADGLVLHNADGKVVSLEELVFARAFAVVGHTWLG
jgi:hypothetical protein